MHYKKIGYLYILLFLSLLSGDIYALTINDTIWQGKSHFIIDTESAIYFYDKSGGGFSSILDKTGNDWISFNDNGNDIYPNSAAGRFRGLPNFVFGSKDSGAGHPGFEQCESHIISNNEISTQTLSGKWQWRWQFDEHFAVVTMEKLDEKHAYWFLYEGTVGGSFQPAISYWGTNTRQPSNTTPDYFKGEKIFENWSWVFFGRKDVDRIFYIVMETPDNLLDTFSYLGNSDKGIHSENGMVVFGFGRKEGAVPLMNNKNNRFTIGFYEQPVITKKAYKKLSKFLNEQLILK